ncbi:PREDICTED: uncharacterized protein LOC106791457 [Polistes canadensis]|uniref:uncharacterized protein LOC106791457 n=1 Tax=Polistes canadensis TaxID=91411 RepID=UPI000718F20D|nr:PREDICTED: uncharacterized protein LOC106791457 [Polistes canadensis]
MDKNYIPIIKGAKCARKHPDWSITTLQPLECTKLRSSNQQRMWEEYINSGRAVYYKYSFIDSRTLDCLKEARKNNRPVTENDLQQWALEAAKEFQSDNFIFKASPEKLSKKSYFRLRLEALHIHTNDEDLLVLPFPF